MAPPDRRRDVATKAGSQKNSHHRLFQGFLPREQVEQIGVGMTVRVFADQIVQAVLAFRAGDIKR
jgi:hypothetical protein